jgi:hypothetical protein
MNLSRRRILEMLAWAASLAVTAPALSKTSSSLSSEQRVKLVMIDGWILREDDLQEISPNVA